jgi:hypothetical protein
MAYKKGDLTSDDLNYFNTAKRRVDQTYKAGLAQNEWQRKAATSAYQRSDGDLRAKFAQARRQLPSAYARAGMLNSGIYARGLDQWQSDKIREQGNLRAGYDQQMAGLSLADRQLAELLWTSTYDINTAHAARQASVAEALRAARGG